MSELERARNQMVDVQIVERGVRDPQVLAAMRTVPREVFVEPGLEEFAYDDEPLPIDEGQTISQPYIVARMIEAAELKSGERALEVGTGSGYGAAVMSRIAHEVYTIERYPTLSAQAQQRFDKLGYSNIRLRVGDGSHGWPEAAPFDAILVTAGTPEIPAALEEQLAIGGRLVIPVGDRLVGQTLRKIRRIGATTYEDDSLEAVRFVPLVGEDPSGRSSAPDSTL